MQVDIRVELAAFNETKLHLENELESTRLEHTRQLLAKTGSLFERPVTRSHSKQTNK